ncbi:MAG TPA: RluA family pseudouridine synthase [Polyangiaceae bacterium]|nr:RluA family pseudouridine synthase [Polyangiaceae bacterium]
MSAQRFVLGAEQRRERVDKVLARLLPEVSRSTVQRWIEEGRVLVDGKPCRQRDSVSAGSEVQVEAGPRPPSEADPDPSVELEVCYEDAALLVVNKPAGLVVHPARGHRTGTLVNGLLARPGFALPSADPEDEQGSLRPGIVHRIDKDTSGLLVVAKDERAREGLKTQLAQHSVERAYLALTVGSPTPGTIRTLHARDPKSRLRFTSRTNQGKPAVTHVRVLERLAGGRAAFIECRLETGRTHQIRVHLSEQSKTPLLSDSVYGARSSPAKDIAEIAAAMGRQALHAAVLGFVHPISGEALRFEAPPPADFARALESLRALP